MDGLFIEGIFCGGTTQIKDGVTSYQYLVTDGNAQAYRIKCDEDLFAKKSFGDNVKFLVRVNCFRDRVYFAGECVG